MIELQGAVEESAKSQVSIRSAVALGGLAVADGPAPAFRQDHAGLATARWHNRCGGDTPHSRRHSGSSYSGRIALAIIMRNSGSSWIRSGKTWRPGSIAYRDRRVAVRRFRPITLTAAAAVLALALVGEVFWAPMALAMGGLVAATVLTLTFLPAM